MLYNKLNKYFFFQSPLTCKCPLNLGQHNVVDAGDILVRCHLQNFLNVLILQLGEDGNSLTSK